MLTVLEVIKKTTDFFAGRGIENPRLNAEQLIGHGLKLKRMQLYLQFERPVTDLELEAIRPLVRRRGLREPLQYVIGETEFWGLNLKTDRRALIPRPETEYLMEILVERLETAPASILDLGTGSGALALALARQYPDAAIMAVDQSEEALALARENAQSTGLDQRVTWLNSNWFGSVPVSVQFDLIVANPPYLTADETAQAAPEVRDHEPVSALISAGPEALADLSAIISAAPMYLKPRGLLALETGILHHAALAERANAAGFAWTESRQDLTGRDRYFLARTER